MIEIEQMTGNDTTRRPPVAGSATTEALWRGAQARIDALGQDILRAMGHARTALAEWELPATERVLREAPALQAQARDIELSCAAALPGCRDELTRFRLDAAIRNAQRLRRVVHQLGAMAMHLGHVLRLNARPDSSALLSLYLLAEIEWRDALLARTTGDTTLARAVLDRDRELDERFRCELENVVRDLSLGLHETEVGLSLIFILRAVERMGDHAKELASASLVRHPGPLRV